MVDCETSPSTKLRGGGRGGKETPSLCCQTRRRLGQSDPNCRHAVWCLLDACLAPSDISVFHEKLLSLRRERRRQTPCPFVPSAQKPGSTLLLGASHPTGQDVKRGVAAQQVGEHPPQ